jgi:hypothetical protein
LPTPHLLKRAKKPHRPRHNPPTWQEPSRLLLLLLLLLHQICVISPQKMSPLHLGNLITSSGQVFVSVVVVAIMA